MKAVAELLRQQVAPLPAVSDPVNQPDPVASPSLNPTHTDCVTYNQSQYADDRTSSGTVIVLHHWLIIANKIFIGILRQTLFITSTHILGF